LARSRRVIDADDDEAGNGPLRLCALTRAPLPKENLIRFVAGPDGTLYPDPATKLPGRGVWVTASLDKVREAVKARVFARSLKREIKVPHDLAEQVAVLLERRALDALSLANKAGLVTAGFAQVDALIEKGSVVALLHARDAAPGGAEKLDRKYKAIARAAGRDAVIETLFTVDQMSLAIGRSNVVHAALTKGGATEKFLNEAGRVVRYRPVPVEEKGRSGAPDP
jgi:predicted RNA-binding protein YlxR (DUF448 family)